jgi:hypothetical protein
MDFIFGLLLGAIVVVVVFYIYRSYFTRNKTEEQSVVLLEKIRNVSKLITVESDFSEIMHYSDVKNSFLNLITSHKKAIVLANSKVMVGFDMKQIRIEPHAKKKLLTITHFPAPEVLSIQTDVEYYDVKNGLFNKFEAKDLTELNKKVKENIENKIPKSGVLLTANEKALETVKMIEQIVDTFGWKLSYNELNLHNNPQKKVTHGQTNEAK